MTGQHPLTDEIIEEITWFDPDADDMHAAADWQLDQVIQAWEQCMEESRTSIQGDSVLVPRRNLERFIHCFDQKLKAMRPQQQQQETP